MGITHARQATDGDDFSASGKDAWNQEHVVSYPLEVSGSTTWANRPDATLNAGNIIRISDIGASGSLWMSDGTRWYPLNGQVVLGMSGSAVSCDATTDENTLASGTLPALAAGIHGTLHFETNWTWTSSGNSKTPRMKLGATTLYTRAETATVFAQLAGEIQFSGATGNQHTTGVANSAFYQATNNNRTTGTNDGTTDLTWSITGQKASAGETMTLNGYRVVLLTP